MRQCSGLNDLGVHATDRLCDTNSLLTNQFLGQSAGDLRDLESMCQTIMKYISFAGGDNLCNAIETPECRGVEDAIPVALSRRALVVSTISRMQAIKPARRHASILVEIGGIRA
jgi:hypothetical protein